MNMVNRPSTSSDPMATLLADIRDLKDRMNGGQLTQAEFCAAEEELVELDGCIAATKATTREGAVMAAHAARLEVETFWLDDGAPGSATLRALLAAFDMLDAPLGTRPIRKSAAAGEIRYLTTRDAAAMLRKSVATLARWRSQGGGPRYVKLGGEILYDASDLREFVAGKRRSGTREPLL